MNIDLLSLPFIGAFIGYFTNYVAIKMLFLPKKPYFVFGVRVPFTPGLIPKKRKDLVEKISDVVSNKVVNKKDIIKYIYKKKNRAFLYEFSRNLIDGLLSRNVSSLNLDYEKIRQAIENFLDKNLDNLIKERFSDFRIDIDYFVYNAFLEIDTKKPIKQYISKDKLHNIKSLTDDLSYQAVIKLSETMDTPEVKQLVKEKMSDALNKYADDTNILMASFVSMVSPLIEDNEKIVDSIIEQIKALLTDKTTKRNIAESVYGSLEEGLLDRDIEYVLNKIGAGSMDSFKTSVSSKLKELFEKMSIKSKLIEGAISSIDKKRLSEDMTLQLKEFADNYTFADILNVIKPDIVQKLPSMAVNNLLYVMRKESERIFNFDISKIAKDRLDKLDISDIEDVVLNISKDQFRYINIFGGILGFLIGFVEVVISTSGFHL